MTVLLYLLFFFFSLGQAARISIASQEVNIYAYEIVLLILTIFFIVRIRTLNSSRAVVRWTGIWGAYMLAVLIVTAYRFSGWQNIVAGLYFARLSLYFVFFLYLSQYLKVHPSAQKVLQKALIGGTVLILTFSYAQYFLYPDIGNLFYLGWDPHLYRMSGTFLEPTIAGSVYGLLLIYIVFHFKRQPYSVLLVSLLVTAIFLTYSRGVFAGVLGTAIAYTAFHSVRKWWVLGFVAICLIGLFLLPRRFGEGVNLLRTSTIESRIENYQEAINIWKKNPILGIGYNHIRHVRPLQQSVRINEPLSHSGASFHSSFLVILVTGGLMGLILAVKVLWEMGRMHQVAMLSTVYISIISLTDNVLLHPFVLLIWVCSIVIPFRTAR